MIATIRNRFVVREGRFGRVLIAFMVMGFAALIVADKSMIRARNIPSAICTCATAMGSENRRGPALPGLMKHTPSRSSIEGRCECPAITA